jgi:hypothetical protein
MAVTDTLTEISSAAQLRELLGTPADRVLTKERARLHADAVPPHAQIVKSVQPCAETLEELERHYGPQYESLLYG